MSLLAKENSSNVEPIPEGCLTAVCYSVVDIGTQYSEKFEKASRKVVVSWELPELRMEVERDGKKLNLPRAISKRYTLSLGEKSILRHDLTAWRGRSFTDAELKGFDLKKLLGAAAQIQIIHNRGADGKIYSNVSTLMALPKGVAAPKPENEQVFFSLEHHKGTDAPPALPSALPPWVQKLIKESREWEKWTLKARTQSDTVPERDAVPAGPAEGEDDVCF